MSQPTAVPQGFEPDSARTQRLLRDLQQAPVMIWTTGLDRRCDWVNAVWLAFTGRPLEAQLGNGWWADVHPQDVEWRKGILDTSFDAKVPYTLDFRLRARDGSHRWMLETAAPRYGPHLEEEILRGFHAERLRPAPVPLRSSRRCWARARSSPRSGVITRSVCSIAT
jgi:PAS domain S-box-containing protein